MDVSEIQIAVESRLPSHARWLMPDGTPLDFTFYRAPRRLTERLAAEPCEAIVERAEAFIVFGEYNYAEGGGATAWLAVNNVDGRVFSIDIELDEPVTLLNSSLHAFIETFWLLHKYLGNGLRLSTHVRTIAKELDKEAYSRSEWRGWIEYLTA